MTPPRPEQPATVAGRALLDWNHECILYGEGLEAPNLLTYILAIEREAAAPLSVAELAAALWDTSEAGDDVPYIDVPAAYRKETDEWAAAILAEIERGRG